MQDYRITTFLTLCRLMNYRKTAEALNMTQPAVTQHIHYLEEYYGCRLFEYDHHTLTMTPDAQILKMHAESMQYEEQKLQEKLGHREQLHYRIGTTKTVGECVIGSHVAEFLSEPGNLLTVITQNTDSLLELLRNGEIDFAIIEGSFDDAEFDSMVYASEPFVGICSENHPFAGREILPSELVGESLIIREEGSGSRRIMEALLESSGLPICRFPKVTCVSSLGLIASLVEQQAGVTFAYRALCTMHPSLREFTLKGISVSHDLCYVYLKSSESKKAVSYFDSFRI